MQRPVVLLPLPDSPTRPNISPSSIAKLTSSTARTIDGLAKRPCLRDEVLDEAAHLQQRRHHFIPGNRCQQRSRVRVCRLTKDLAHGALFNDLALVHDGDAVRHFGDDAEVVRDEQQRQIEPLLELAQQLEHLRLDRDVERRRRLVGDDQRRSAGERDRDHHALPHAARQLMRVVAHAARRIGDAHGVEQLDGARVAPRRASARPCTVSASAI